MTAPQWLKDLGIPEACIDQKSSCSEKSRKFTIRPAQGDEIWRVKVDVCWVDTVQKKVDYLFWGQSRSRNKCILLVELKGGNYGKALEQIESTLQRLCKHSTNNIIHQGIHEKSPGHNLVKQKGVQAIVVLSHGRGIPQKLKEKEKLRQRYGIQVNQKTNQFVVNGIDAIVR